ncbi:MAG: hypothetical protein M3Y28_10575 [Armatimonadota bacterium]|nr:hypothetical protein [Armatimonadota bacterium]
MALDADDAAKDQASENVLGQNHPLAAVCGVFKDNPVLDAVMEEVYANRRRQIAEVEAEIEAENESALQGVTTMAQDTILPVANKSIINGNGTTDSPHPSNTLSDADQNNPWLNMIEVFKDDPMLDVMMEEIYKIRRRQIAELEAETETVG